MNPERRGSAGEHQRRGRVARPVGYRAVLAAPWVTRLLSGTLIGRLPAAMAPVTILIALAHHGIAQAGALSAGQGLAASISQPLAARAAHRHGQRRVLATTTAATTAVYTALAATHTGPPAVTAALILLSGAGAPPLQSSQRGRWPDLVPPNAQSTAQALDAASTELLYVAAPLLAAGLCLISPSAAFAVAAATGAAGTALVITAPLPRPPRRTTRAPADPLGPLRCGGLSVLLPVHLAVGICLGAVPVAALQIATRTHNPALTGQVTAALFAGSLTGGLLYGARRLPGTARRHLTAAAAGFAASLTALPLTAAHPLAAIAAAAGAGLWLAPLLTAGQLHAQHLAPPRSRAEAAGWLIGALGAGEAAGTALSASARLPAAAWPPAAAGLALALLLAPSRRGPEPPEYAIRPAAPSARRYADENQPPMPAHAALPVSTGDEVR